MIEIGKPLAHPSKKPSMTPKAIIHQRFGSKASYSVDEVQDSANNGCPGLAISLKGPCLYRCTLHLPEISIVSGTFRRKKDAEQEAAEKAIEKLGISQKKYNPTVEEAWDDLSSRIAYLFANEFLSSLHPLSGHLKATLRRQGHFNGCVPVPVIAAYDARLNNICKYIENEAEMNSQVVISLILKAAAKLTDIVLIPDEQLALKRRSQYHPDIISSLNLEPNLCENTSIEAVFIPASFDKAVEPLMLNVAATGYYLDAIACWLRMQEASDLLISRTIGKASSELRLYFSAPKRQLLDQLSVWEGEQASHFEGSLNARASYFAGQNVYGDAILASVGYTWKSTDLFHEAVSLRSYYRILVSMRPSGIYKISRQAILASKLPLTLTMNGNWKGSLPRDILCAFCRFHHLSEPVFSTHSKSLDHSLGSPGSCKKLKVMQSSKVAKGGSALTTARGDKVESVEVFNCDVKIYSKTQKLILHCAPQESHRKQTDAMQSSALKVLSWLDIIFEEPDISVDKLGLLAYKSNILFSQYYFKVFSLCRSIHNIGITRGQDCGDNAEGDDLTLIDLAGKSSGVAPYHGSVACISYTVFLFGEDVCVKERLESCEEFEFEMGSGVVLPHLELPVAHMNVGQSAYFQSDVPPTELILAAAEDSATTLSILSSCNCKLEYCITLLQVTEPLEERMEQALFSPPLSKQRVEFALQQIKESYAVSLVDFGCGSGSLLDSLLSYPTLLEKIVGVDISQRSLARAAKSLHSKLNRLSDSKDPSSKIKSVALYAGSITNFDSRLHGFDIATCLEVIEHMEEEDACLFGDVVLRCFRPRIFIVSTPNYEYNAILQRSSPPPGQEADEACKFRNCDHKFEWTRAEFKKWASELAPRHNYGIELSGVGGAGDFEPGFASQIAIFRRHGEGEVMIREEEQVYVPIWEWSREG